MTRGKDTRALLTKGFGLSLLVVFLVLPVFARAALPEHPARDAKVLSIFWREGCAHCAQEKAFLARLQREHPGTQVQLYDVETPAGRALFERVTARFGLPKVTPITVIGRRVLVGFGGEKTTGAEIRRLLATERADLSVPQLLAEGPVQRGGEGTTCPVTGPCGAPEGSHYYFPVPLWGPVDLSEMTLPALSVLLGLIDGFNPCAMWVLVAFLTALLQTGSVKRMIQFAGLFILAETIMYFLILNSWFLTFDFVRADRIVTPLVGVVSLGAGLFFLWEFSRGQAACRVTSLEQRAKAASRINRLAQLSMTPMVVLAIVGMALSVNVIEFACSIGIPQAYTKILDLNRVGLLKREALMGIYIFFYMLDDLVVFGLAIWGAEKIMLTQRYSHLSNLLGGITMLVLGGLLLFAPERLRF
jgi:cytochrome c biogenesis protein CcdA/thiol-disulfide isomerase/thioredoxin